MTRALDHIVWPTRDLDTLAEAFRRLGFTVGRRNRHPWGTENHIVQFDGTFLELLGFAADYEPVAADAPSFPFAGFCARFLARAEAGAAMVVLKSDDAEGDTDRLRQAGLGQGRLLPFTRAAQGPDGDDRTVAFTIAFADLPGLSGLGAFLCQQHRPENFWNPSAQRHANGAAGIAGLTIPGSDPDAQARTLRVLADAAPATGPVVDLGDGSQLTIRPPDGRDGAPIAVVDIRVTDLAMFDAAMRRQGVEVVAAGATRTVRSPALGLTALVFHEGIASARNPRRYPAFTSEAT